MFRIKVIGILFFLLAAVESRAASIHYIQSFDNLNMDVDFDVNPESSDCYTNPYTIENFIKSILGNSEINLTNKSKMRTALMDSKELIHDLLAKNDALLLKTTLGKEIDEIEVNKVPEKSRKDALKLIKLMKYRKKIKSIPTTEFSLTAFKIQGNCYGKYTFQIIERSPATSNYANSEETATIIIFNASKVFYKKSPLEFTQIIISNLEKELNEFVKRLKVSKKHIKSFHKTFNSPPPKPFSLELPAGLQ